MNGKVRKSTNWSKIDSHFFIIVFSWNDWCSCSAINKNTSFREFELAWVVSAQFQSFWVWHGAFEKRVSFQQVKLIQFMWLDDFSTFYAKNSFYCNNWCSIRSWNIYDTYWSMHCFIHSSWNVWPQAVTFIPPFFPLRPCRANFPNKRNTAIEITKYYL